MTDSDRFRETVEAVVRRKAIIFRYMFITQAIAGGVLLLFGWGAGHVHYHLIKDGVRSQGQIIAFKEEHIGGNYTGMSSTGFMPIVEFRVGSDAPPVRFKDWAGSSSEGGLHTRVPILYDRTRPTVAMIDRPIANWIPWAPMILVGLFLLSVSFKGFLALFFKP